MTSPVTAASWPTTALADLGAHARAAPRGRPAPARRGHRGALPPGGAGEGGAAGRARARAWAGRAGGRVGHGCGPLLEVGQRPGERHERGRGQGVAPVSRACTSCGRRAGGPRRHRRRRARCRGSGGQRGRPAGGAVAVRRTRRPGRGRGPAGRAGPGPRSSPRRGRPTGNGSVTRAPRRRAAHEREGEHGRPTRAIAGTARSARNECDPRPVRHRPGRPGRAGARRAGGLAQQRGPRGRRARPRRRTGCSAAALKPRADAPSVGARPRRAARHRRRSSRRGRVSAWPDTG